MNLQQLASQYRESANALESRILQLKTELLTARGEDAFSLERRIDLLYAELLDARKVMGYLNHYYH